MELTFEEIRVLGALVEKELATPEYYPMTVNGLVAACNQKTGRDPVTEFDDETVQAALDGLYRKRLAGQVTGSGSRAVKYRHTLAETLELDRPRRAVLGLLMLRGPQTSGELRGRSGRMFEFESVESVEAVLADLAAREEPLVIQLERRPGQKEARCAHLFAGVPEPGGEPPAPMERAGRLESEIEALRAELAALRSEFEAFKATFE